MTTSDQEARQQAQALVDLMRSDQPLGRATAIMAHASIADWLKVTDLFVRPAWQDDNQEVPERGARIHDWLIGLRDAP